jgi:hypothetical protein
MLKKMLFITLSLSTLLQFSCNTIAPKDFDGFAKKFVVDYRQIFPDAGPLSMDNESLSRLTIPTVTYQDSVRDFHRNYSAELKQFDRSILSPSDMKGATKIDNILKNIGAFITDNQINPQRYNVLNGFQRILNADYASDDYRLQILQTKCQQVPLFYEAAKQRLQNVNRADADAAVEQHLATFLFFDKELPAFFAQNGRAIPPQYVADMKAAKMAIKDYVAFVESFRLN